MAGIPRSILCAAPLHDGNNGIVTHDCPIAERFANKGPICHGEDEEQPFAAKANDDRDRHRWSPAPASRAQSCRKIRITTRTSRTGAISVVCRLPDRFPRRTRWLFEGVVVLSLREIPSPAPPSFLDR